MTGPAEMVLDVPGPSNPAIHARRRWLVVALTAVAAAVVVGLASYVHWRDNARVLLPYGRGGNGYTAGQIGKTFYAEAAIVAQHGEARHEFVNLRSLRPQVTENSARATIAMLICVPAPGQGGIGTAISTHPSCSSTRPFAPGSLDLGTDGNQVIFAVTAHRLGTVRIAGCEASFEIGSRSGTQHTGFFFIDHVRIGTK